MENELSKKTPAPSAAVRSASTKPTKTTTITAVPAAKSGTVVSATVDSCVFFATRKP